MANVTAKTSAETAAQLAVTTTNPTVNAAAGGRKIVHVTLVCDGVDVTPASIHTALDAQYATVAGEKDQVANRCYIFNIGPA